MYICFFPDSILHYPVVMKKTNTMYTVHITSINYVSCNPIESDRLISYHNYGINTQYQT